MASERQVNDSWTMAGSRLFLIGFPQKVGGEHYIRVSGNVMSVRLHHACIGIGCCSLPILLFHTKASIGKFYCNSHLTAQLIK